MRKVPFAVDLVNMVRTNNAVKLANVVAVNLQIVRNHRTCPKMATRITCRFGFNIHRTNLVVGTQNIYIMLVGMAGCMHACLYACSHACRRARLSDCMYACMHDCMHACLIALLMFMHVCVPASVYACLLVCRHAGLLACLHVCLTRSMQNYRNIQRNMRAGWGTVEARLRTG